MANRSIYRSINLRRSERSVGEAPAIGKVERMPKRYASQRSSRRRKGRSEIDTKQGRFRRRVALAWTAVILVVTLATIAFAIWSWSTGQLERAAQKSGARAKSVELRVASKFPSPSEDEAIALAKAAIACRDPALVADHFHCGHFSPDHVVGYLKDIGGDWSSDNLQTAWLGSIDANRMLMDGVLMLASETNQARNRLMLLTPDSLGRWKVDFEAFARASTLRIEKDSRVRLRGASRVVFMPDVYYNDDFRDEARWKCYAIRSLDHDSIYYGYCLRDSPQQRALDAIVKNHEERSLRVGLPRAVLDLRTAPTPGTRQFEIERVVAEDWVTSETPYENHFR